MPNKVEAYTDSVNTSRISSLSLSSFETLKTPKQAFVDILTAKAFFEILVCLNIKRSWDGGVESKLPSG